MKLYTVYEPETGHTKIGISKNPRDRLTHLQTANPRPLLMPYVFNCEDASQSERALHAAFRRCRVRGEWFKVAPREVYNRAVTDGLIKSVEYVSVPPPARTEQPRRDWGAVLFSVWAWGFWIHAAIMLCYVLFTGANLTIVEALVLVLYWMAGTMAVLSSNGHGRTDN